jgi:hypothetical protein
MDAVLCEVDSMPGDLGPFSYFTLYSFCCLSIRGKEIVPIYWQMRYVKK